MARGRLLPFVFLLSWIVLFGAAALGASVRGFDDHPGQLYRVWLVATQGFAPWRWSDGWWAGYPELQFYPPGFPYAGALIHWLSFGALGVEGAYHTLVWIAWAAPGVTAYLLLGRVLENGWLALPGAFVALTFSAGLASGVEGGVHIGMVAARLAWAAIPLVLWLFVGASSDLSRVAPLAIPLVALIALTHPAHAPAAVAAILLASALARERARRAAIEAVAIVACAAALTAFWSIPLLARIAETRALAWGTLGATLGLLARAPLVSILAALAVLAARSAAGHGARLIALFPWAVAGVVAIDALGLEPSGLRWLPADRLVDGVALAIVLAAGLVLGRILERVRTARLAIPGLSLAAVLALAVVSIPGEALTPWPKRAEWPELATVERGFRLDDLWSRLRGAPPGRILFTRSGVPLVYGRDWWRPHSHVTALTAVRTGRAIVHGTFTHASPIAALVYRGDAGRAPVRALAETLDGQSLFGLPLAALDAATFNRYADRLGVSTVVGLEDDASSLGFLDANPRFRRAGELAPFVLYTSAPVNIPTQAEDGRWTFTANGAAESWITTRCAYYPLWRAFDAETPLETRRGELGDLEVRLARADPTITLRYAPGAPEIAGVVVSLIAGGIWLVVTVRAIFWRRSRPASA